MRTNVRARFTCGILAFLLLVGVGCFDIAQPRAYAATSLVQSNSATSGGGGTSVAAAYGSSVTANHLLVAICDGGAATTFTTPAGFTAAKNESSTTSQGIFYKIAAGTETTVTCAAASGATMPLTTQIYEYSGVATTSPLDAVNNTTSTGTNSTPSSGSVTTSNANDLLIASVGITNSTGTAESIIALSWTNSFAAHQTGTDSYVSGHGKSAVTYNLAFSGADHTVTATGTYSTSATAGASGAWIGQIAAFKAAPVGSLSADIVDGSGSSVASPSTALSAVSRSFACQTVAGTLGVSTQKVRVSNTTANPAWTLSVAATGGASANWSTGTSQYDFNDPSSLGCSDGSDADSLAGDLTINPAAGTITPQSGCTATGVSLGSSAAFSQGTLDSITIASAGSSAGTGCYWDLTGIVLSQTVPSMQQSGSYVINLTLTLVAN